jgi:hypothetical protein
MSIVITVLDPRKVIQVSDTRVTAFKDNSVMSEIARKTILVFGNKAKFVVGWVGLAVDATGRHETGRWLWETLVKMDAVDVTIEDIATRLAAAATTELAKLQAANKCLGVVMAGWDSEPFVVTVSNYLEVKNKRTPDEPVKTHHIPSVTEAKCSPTFKPYIQRYAKKTKRDYLVAVMGDLRSSKLKRHFTGLKKRLKKNSRASQITAVCREIALEASTHTYTIGRTLIGAELSRRGKNICTYYSENGKPEILIPPMLEPRGASIDGKIIELLDGRTRIEAKIVRRNSPTSR